MRMFETPYNIKVLNEFYRSQNHSSIKEDTAIQPLFRDGLAWQQLDDRRRQLEEEKKQQEAQESQVDENENLDAKVEVDETLKALSENEVLPKKEKKYKLSSLGKQVTCGKLSIASACLFAMQLKSHADAGSGSLVFSLLIRPQCCIFHHRSFSIILFSRFVLQLL